MILNIWGVFDKCMPSETEAAVNEELGSYFESIPAWTRKSMVCEELHLRKTLKAKAFSNKNLEKCRTDCGETKIGLGDQLMDAPENYEILNNPIYQDRFQFNDIHFRNADYEDDIVKLILFMIYLGYVKEGAIHLK
jgi:hypothetical protein